MPRWLRMRRVAQTAAKSDLMPVIKVDTGNTYKVI